MGECGDRSVTIGGTVTNEKIYFEKGTDVTRHFNPQSIDNYGIEWIKLNGEKIKIDSKVSVSNISEDYTIEVKFIEGGEQVAIKNLMSEITVPYTLSNNTLTVSEKSSFSLYTLRGQQLFQVSLLKGQQVNLNNFTTGVYIAKLSGMSRSNQIKIKIE